MKIMRIMMDRLKIYRARKVRVRNMVDTTKDPVPKGFASWFDYWFDYWKRNIKTGKYSFLSICPKCKKITDDLVGAHVCTVGNKTENENGYIYPLCRHCNSEYQESNKEDAIKDEFDAVEDYLCPLPPNSKCKSNK